MTFGGGAAPPEYRTDPSCRRSSHAALHRKIICVAQKCHYTSGRVEHLIKAPQFVFRFAVPPRPFWDTGRGFSHPLHRSRRMIPMTNDPFSASVIPFEVPEQMRAFAEKGVSQARDNYAKLKDAAETHNVAIEAVFTSASKGASEYTAKLMEFMKANTTASLDFAQQLLSIKSPAEVMELWTSHTRKQVQTLSAQAKEL